MLHLAMKAFHPSPPPFPLLHVDTTWKFREMIAFRDETVKRLGLKLIVHINEDGVKRGINPFDSGSNLHTQVMKTDGLKQAPPPKPEPPKPEPPKFEPDQLAKLLEQQKKAQPQKPADTPKKAEPNFDANALEKLLQSKETPQKSASRSTEASAKSSAAAGRPSGWAGIAGVSACPFASA